MHVNARAIIERDAPFGREILIQTRDKPFEGGRWLELPGGRVEEYELLYDALKREIKEETGLTLHSVDGEQSRLVAGVRDTQVECLKPFAVYQTIQGPVDSLGFYFRCRAEGELKAVGGDALGARWIAIKELRYLVSQQPALFSWVDLAGIQYYLASLE